MREAGRMSDTRCGRSFGRRAVCGPPIIGVWENGSLNEAGERSGWARRCTGLSTVPQSRRHFPHAYLRKGMIEVGAAIFTTFPQHILDRWLISILMWPI